jgi:hypothetical protein
MSNRLLPSAAAIIPAAVLGFAFAVPAAYAVPTANAMPAASVPATPAAPLPCHASMTNSHPADYTTTGVKIRTAPYARAATVAHYRTTNHKKSRTANSHGRVTIDYYISGATPGFRVKVSVQVTKGNRKGSCSTSFTPHR